MAITPNGMIARKNGKTDFVTGTEWKSFSAMIKKTRNLIVGKTTYHVMVQGKEFDKINPKSVIVVSRNPKSIALLQGHFAVTTPQEALALLKKQGYQTALAGGGGTLNASFLKAKLVDEIFLDVEPFLLGEGKPLFNGKQFETQLKLLGTKKLSKNEVQLHYKVLKK